MFCTRCGSKMEQGQGFCSVCGAPADAGGAPQAPIVGSEAPREDQERQGGESPRSDGNGAVSDELASPDQEVSPNAAEGSVLSSGFEPDDLGEDAQGDATVLPAPKKGRGKWAAIASVAVVVMVAVIACALLLPAKNADANVAYYGADEAVKVLPTTHIVMYGDNGEPLDEYDLVVADGEGAVETYHVAGGYFTSEDLGVGPGSYSMVVRDPSGDFYNLPNFEVADEEEEDGVHGDEVAVKPQGQEGAESQDKEEPDESEGQDQKPGIASARQVAFGLYWDKVKELQKMYGEPSMEGDGGMQQLTGLCGVMLIDLDQDGMEEMLTVHFDPAAEDGSTGEKVQIDGWADTYVVRVWAFDEKSRSISCVFEGGPYTTNGGFIGYRICKAGDGRLFVSSEEDIYAESSRHYKKELFGLDDGGDLGVVSTLEFIHSLPYSAGNVTSYFVDGESVSEDAYRKAENKIPGLSYDCYMLNIPVRFVGESSCRAPKESVEMTERTIETLKNGMMGRFDGELAASDIERDSAVDAANTADNGAAMAAYAEVLNDYRTAIQQYQQNGVVPSTSKYLDEIALLDFGGANWGYAYRDLDGNGIVELLISVGSSGNGIVERIFTISDDGSVKELIRGMARCRVHLCQDGSHVLVNGSGGATTGSWEAYIVKGSSLVSEGSLMWEPQGSIQQMTRTYSDGSSETQADNGSSEASALYNEWMSEYPVDEGISWTPIDE